MIPEIMPTVTWHFIGMVSVRMHDESKLKVHLNAAVSADVVTVVNAEPPSW
jgi:hypothetical protein